MMRLAIFLLSILVSPAIADTGTNRAFVKHKLEEIRCSAWLSLGGGSVRRAATTARGEACRGEIFGHCEKRCCCSPDAGFCCFDGITVDTCTDPSVLVDVGVADVADLTTVRVTTTMTTVMTLGIVPGTTAVTDSKLPIQQATTEQSVTASESRTGVAVSERSTYNETTKCPVTASDSHVAVPTITETTPLRVVSSGTVQLEPRLSLAWVMVVAIVLFG
ncbi:hypothetical protein AK830_g1027 [Neonectria ditissima]|uniref:SMB domain-containing protein n=1 Tax=Neonectria ditissima TaxID=78410 RepID=A0A0P7BNT1_9HYPO|nr:hypothetical protein AK830_g1027 [Neonectria ditissima]